MTKEKGYNKVEKYFRKHMVKYLIGGGCLAVGTAVGLYLGNKGIINIQLVNTGSVEQIQNIDKSVNILTRRGHAGNIIKRVSDGKQWSSQRQLCRELGIDGRDLWRHLKGQTDDIKGEVFEKVGSFNTEE